MNNHNGTLLKVRDVLVYYIEYDQNNSHRAQQALAALDALIAAVPDYYDEVERYEREVGNETRMSVAAKLLHQATQEQE